MQALTLCDLLYVSQREVIVVHYLHGVWRYQGYSELNKSSRFSCFHKLVKCKEKHENKISIFYIVGICSSLR